MSKEKVKKTKEQIEAMQAKCSHGSRKSKMDGKSAFREISIDSGGTSIMKCMKCGLEKRVTVNAHYLTDAERYKNGRHSVEKRYEPRTRKPVVEMLKEAGKALVKAVSGSLKAGTAKA